MRRNILFLALLLVSGCCGTGGGNAAFTPLSGQTAESQWELVLRDGDATLNFTAAMAVSLSGSREGRLYVILPYGQTLAKCVIANGRADCESPAPGTGPLIRKTATPLARMVEADFQGGKATVFAADGGPAPLLGRGWRAESDGEWLVYREDGTGWQLRLKRNG